MVFVRNRILLLMALGSMGAAVQAQDCETIRAQIESRIRANGVTHFSLEVVDQGASARGRVVGSCGKGSQKIVYAPLTAEAARKPASPGGAAPARPTEPLLTECKDGTVSVGGDCRKR